MNRFKNILCHMYIILPILILLGCGGEDVYNPPPELGPPGNLMGAPASLDEGIDMMLMWTPAEKPSIVGYNVYKKVGNAAAEKLNILPVNESSFGPDPYYPKTLWFADTTYDTLSAENHTYYVTTLSGSEESSASNTVQCIPNTIDRAETIDNLSPDNINEIDRQPTFSWSDKPGAAYYFIMLSNADDLWTWWVHRVTATSCAFKSASGINYIDAAEDTLFSDHDYRWLLWAVNANNCGFAIANAEFTTTNPNRVITLAQTTVAAGKYRICWDQIDKTGAQVPTGDYIAHMQVGVYDTSIAFEIRDTGLVLPANPPPNCDEDFTGVLPTQFELELNGEIYGKGDTVAVTFSMPLSGEVIIEINK